MGAQDQNRRESLRDAQKTLTRQRLLDGAVEVFSRIGYPAATIDDIAEAAGVARATLYLHFKNKLEIVEGLYEEVRPESIRNFKALELVIERGGTRDDMRDWLREVLTWYDSRRTVILALEQAIDIEGEAASRLRRQYSNLLPNLNRTRPEEERAEANLRVWLLTKLLSRVFVMWRVGGLFADLEEDLIIEVLTDFWTNGLRLEVAADGSA